MQYQYKRSYLLTIQNRLSGKVIEIKDLTLTFDIKRSVDNKKESNTATVSVFNLSEDTLSLIDAQPRYCYLNLDIGYDGRVMNILLGDILNTSTKRSGTERETTFTIAEGFKSLNTVKISESFPENSTIEDVLNYSLAQTDVSKGVIVGDGVKKKLTYGYPAHGTFRQVLDDICYGNDLEWMIANNRLYVKDKGGLLYPKAPLERVVVISANSGMIDIPFRHDVEGTRDIGQADIGDVEVLPQERKLTKTGKVRKVTKEKYRRRGVKVVALINPEVIPNSLIKIESTTTLLSGFYRVRTIQYKGDMRGNDWTMEIFGDLVENKA